MQVNYGRKPPTVQKKIPWDNWTWIHRLEASHDNQNHVELRPTKVRHVEGPTSSLLTEGVAAKWAKGVARTQGWPNRLCLSSPSADTWSKILKSQWWFWLIFGLTNFQTIITTLCKEEKLSLSNYTTRGEQLTYTFRLLSSRVRIYEKSEGKLRKECPKCRLSLQDVPAMLAYFLDSPRGAPELLALTLILYFDKCFFYISKYSWSSFRI